MCIFRISLVDFLENTAYSVPVAHFKLSKVLIFSIESFLEVRNTLFRILQLLDLLVQPI
jgi:hypothetical protein